MTAVCKSAARKNEMPRQAASITVSPFSGSPFTGSPFKWFAAALLACASVAALSQPYPNRTINMVVPFPPGGIADLTARVLAPAMGTILGQSIVIENRAGAGGAVGMAHLAKQKPDGYALMTALSSIVIIPASDLVSGRPPMYQMADFTPIALLSADPTILLVPSDSPWKTLDDLMKDARANPGKISYSSSGTYGTTHTAMEMLAQAAGVKLLHVPYKGGGPAMTALLANEVNVTAQSPGVANPHVKAGKVRVLGSWGAVRLPSIADVPTMKELGYDVEFYIWAALLAPAGMPPDVLAKVRGAVKQAMQDQKFRASMGSMNTPISYLDGVEFDDFIAKDAKRLGEVVKRMGKVE